MIDAALKCFECYGRGWVVPDGWDGKFKLNESLAGVPYLDLCSRCDGSGRER
jgi:hypothetical protein